MNLVFENKVPTAYREAFVQKIIQVSDQLGINPNWLMAVINFESAGTFSPSIKNNKTGATGLIQFMPNTAKALGTTTTALAQMSAVQQLDFVYKYYKVYQSKIKSFVDLYLATFFPRAIGREDNYVLQTSNISASLIAQQNPLFDKNKDGKVTVAEIKQVILSRIPSAHIEHFKKKV